jgi:hypothetical protein
MSDVMDLINFSADQKPVEFEQAFTAALADRLATAVQNKKIEVAQSMFGDQAASEDYASAEETDEDNDTQETESEEDTDGETA